MCCIWFVSVPILKQKYFFLYLLHYFKFIIKTYTIKDMYKHNSLVKSQINEFARSSCYECFSLNSI